ncbi:Hpt domain-containing protein [Pedobacter sp. KR3-3]|uniref:Hpt domain-containing protein n=1 Tax=Pedobacter albus TaxID=3113905 RepID=A0ABU7I5S6_9SPHI|nr:Hpt domain-containing protein [Pedobacter sp. KR3-3]MEE1944798.1 Hpt domain-containing protein [Pedobacter sp. KR3-3]
MINANKNNEPLDLSYLREMSGNSAEFIIEMLDAFKKQTPVYLAELEKAVFDADWKKASECAHKMKPTFYYVGREDVRDHMQDIERNARELVDIPGVQLAFEQARDFINNVLYRQLDEAKTVLEKEL